MFAEKLEMFRQINKQEVISWKGKFRAPIQNLGIYPRPIQDSIPVWLGVGGTLASAVRAGKLNLPLIIAILGSSPAQFVPFVDLYRESAAKAGHDVSKLQLAVRFVFGHVAAHIG